MFENCKYNREHNSDLIEIYNTLNEEYFDCELPEIEEGIMEIEWSNRLTASAGIVYHHYNGKQLIRISSHYANKYPEDVEATVLHEMIHIKCPGHGEDFKTEMKRINRLGGIQVSINSIGRAKDGKWLYICTNCNHVHERIRRVSNYKRKRCSCKGKLIEEKRSGQHE